MPEPSHFEVLQYIGMRFAGALVVLPDVVVPQLQRRLELAQQLRPFLPGFSVFNTAHPQVIKREH